jgi:hypothetical protein
LTIDSLSAQDKSFNESVDFIGDPYPFEDLTFVITEVKNELAEPNQLGVVHFGESKEEYKLLLDPQLEKQFDKFFKQALKNTNAGSVATKVVFKELSVNVNSNDTTSLEDLKNSDVYSQRIRELGTKNWKNRNYRISIDYLIKNRVVFSDFAEVDSIAHMSEYSVDQFCSNFFNQSFFQLDQKIVALLLDSNSFLNEAELNEVAEEVVPEEELENMKVQLKYKKKEKFKVLPHRTPVAIQDKIRQDYIKKEFGFYKLNVVYKESEDDIIEVVEIQEKGYSSMTEVRTTRIVAWSLAAAVGFVVGYNSAQEPVGPGPPSGP